MERMTELAPLKAQYLVPLKAGMWGQQMERLSLGQMKEQHWELHLARRMASEWAQWMERLWIQERWLAPQLEQQMDQRSLVLRMAPAMESPMAKHWVQSKELQMGIDLGRY
jgi:hypothetical protein